MSESYEYTGWLRPWLDDILRELRNGDPPAVVARGLKTKHGVHVDTEMIAYVARRYGISIVKMRPYSKAERNAQIINDYRRGGPFTLREIGAMHDLSVEAVRQIIGRDERAAGREEEYQRAVLSAPSIEALPLETIRARISARIFYCFQNEGCDTVGRAMKIPERKLLLINNFGRLSLNEWKAAVARIKTDWLQAHTKDVQAR